LTLPGLTEPSRKRRITLEQVHTAKPHERESTETHVLTSRRESALEEILAVTRTLRTTRDLTLELGPHQCNNHNNPCGLTQPLPQCHSSPCTSRWPLCPTDSNSQPHQSTESHNRGFNSPASNSRLCGSLGTPDRQCPQHNRPTRHSRESKLDTPSLKQYQQYRPRTLNRESNEDTLNLRRLRQLRPDTLNRQHPNRDILNIWELQKLLLHVLLPQPTNNNRVSDKPKSRNGRMQFHSPVLVK